MSEVMRFRLLRSPDRVRPEQDEVIRQLGDDNFLSQLAAAPREDRAALIQGARLLSTISSLRTKLGLLDDVLTREGNRMTPAAIVKVIGDVEALVASPDYLDDRTRLMNTLGALIAGSRDDAAAAQRESLERGVAVQRVLYICGLLELMALKPSPIEDADDVFDALRWRTIALPAGIWPPELDRNRRAEMAVGHAAHALPIAATSRRPAFADLYVVRQDWIRYEAGEIAHIENVLRGENKEREHRRKTETEVTTFTQEEINNFDERDTQTTSRFELATEATREMELALHIDGSLDVKSLAGPTTIAAHIGGSVDYSQSTSDRTATTTSREAVDRAVKRIETRTLATRTARTLTTVDELNRHGIDNRGADTDNVVGIYRWVNKVNRVQVYRYPHRFLLEFQVPEPGAWWRWRQRREDAAIAPQPPTPFTTNGAVDGVRLSVADITEENYAALGARYGVKAMPPAPPSRQTIGANVEMPSQAADGVNIKFAHYDKLTVPDGYRAVHWDARVLSWHNGGYGNDGMQVQVAVGGTSVDGRFANKWASMVDGMAGDLPDLIGTVPIGVMADTPWGFELTFSVTLLRLDALLRKWQQSVYDMLVDGFAQMQAEYARALRGDDSSAIVADGDNTERNRQVIVTELKKHVTELLLSGSMVGYDAMVEGAGGEPAIDPARMRQVAPTVSFMEQAFEWENLTYVLYPYFWGTRSEWPERAGITGADADFAAFLAAGSVRVIVPARPGLEQTVNFFLNTGLPWLGVQAPAPDEPGYLSIDKEIRALQAGAPDGTAVGEAWEVRMPTSLVWLQDGNALPVNPNPLVP